MPVASSHWARQQRCGLLARRKKKLSYDQVPYFEMPDDSEAAGTYIEREYAARIRSAGSPAAKSK